MARDDLMHFADHHAHGPSFCIVDLYRGGRAWLLPRIVGDHPRMLDVLHISKAAVVRGASAWHGGCRFLAGWVDGEDGNGESRNGAGAENSE